MVSPGSGPGPRRRSIAAGVTALGTTVVFAPGAEAATFEVTSTADDGVGSLRQAIVDANGAAGADTITFASGVTGEVTLTTGQLSITDSVTITGPGADQLAVDGNDASRVFYLYNRPATIDVTISDLTIRDGVANIGAGVVNFDENLTLDGVKLDSNAASGDGGGLWSDGFNHTLTVRDSEITGNTAGSDGGGVYVEDTGGPLVIEDTKVSGNTATDDGGGIYFYDPDDSTTLRDVTVSGNTAGNLGGGIYLYDTDNGTHTIERSTISGNTSQNGAGIYLYGPDHPVVIENTTISGNTATVATGTAGVELATSADNVVLRHVTIAGNTSNGGAAGIRAADGGPASLDNSVVADNTGGDDLAGLIELDNTLVENVGAATPTGDAPLTGDPLLAPLANNGGPTQTHRPAPTSPLVDAGADLAVTTDQRGRTRPSGAAPDIGAVELIAPAVTAIAPANGTPGTVVTITGTGFTGASGVTFGGVAATAFTVVDDTTITATVPAGTGTVDTRVSSDGIQSPVVAAAAFTYDVPPSPTPTATPAATPAPTPVPTVGPTSTPPLRCLSRRLFTLTLPSYTRTGTVKLGGKALKQKRTDGRIVYTIDLRNRVAGIYTVRVEIRSKGGKRVTQTRRFRTCVPPKI